MEEISEAILPANRSLRRLMLHRLCWIAVSTGIVLQLTVRDRIPFPVAGLYYALPRPIIFLLTVIAALTAAPRTKRRIVHGVVLAILASWIAWRDFGWHASQAPLPGTQNVVFWNVGRNLIDDISVVDGFLDASPALVGLVETGDLTAEWLADWQARRPEYAFVAPHPGCLLIVRGRVPESGYEQLDFNSHAIWADFDWQGTTVRAVVVDIAANPWISRRKPLQRLEEKLTRWNDGLLIVMGDFNTPDDSVWFTGMRRDFQEIFETAGTGYAPTWPWPAPVLKLDQMWVNRDFIIHRAGRWTTWRSDHRPIWAELSGKAAVRHPGMD